MMKRLIIIVIQSVFSPKFATNLIISFFIYFYDIIKSCFFVFFCCCVHVTPQISRFLDILNLLNCCFRKIYRYNLEANFLLSQNLIPCYIIYLPLRYLIFLFFATSKIEEDLQIDMTKKRNKMAVGWSRWWWCQFVCISFFIILYIWTQGINNKKK